MKYAKKFGLNQSKNDVSNELEDPSQVVDTVIIGNGPSGITLSFLLAGNWPHYNGEMHPDELLNARLKTCSKHIPLLLQDLEFLSQSMEGRCKNRISVLMDALSFPNADVMNNTPSLLNYKYLRNKSVEHVVIGKGIPGGLWQNLGNDIRTISFSNWMSLPGLTFQEWEKVPESNIRRIEAGKVASYYQDYVKLMKLNKYFRNNSDVTSIQPLESDTSCEILWKVYGHDMEKNKSFSYKCRRVILASGTCDIPNTINVPGENLYPTKVFHTLHSFEKALEGVIMKHERIIDDFREKGY